MKKPEKPKQIDWSFETADYGLIILNFLYPLLNYLVEFHYKELPLLDPNSLYTLEDSLIRGLFFSLFFMFLRFVVIVESKPAIVFFVLFTGVGLIFRFMLFQIVLDNVNAIGYWWSVGLFIALHALIHFSRVYLKYFFALKKYETSIEGAQA